MRIRDRGIRNSEIRASQGPHVYFGRQKVLNNKIERVCDIKIFTGSLDLVRYICIFQSSLLDRDCLEHSLSIHTLPL